MNLIHILVYFSVLMNGFIILVSELKPRPRENGTALLARPPWRGARAESNLKYTMLMLPRQKVILLSDKACNSCYHRAAAHPTDIGRCNFLLWFLGLSHSCKGHSFGQLHCLVMDKSVKNGKPLLQWQQSTAVSQDRAKLMPVIADKYKDILANLGDDSTRPGLADTPKRAAQALLFFTKGYEDR